MLNPYILNLSAQVGARLKEQKLTITAAESLTTGNVQAALGAVSGSSAYYVGGLTAYTARLKHDLLGIDAGLLEATNCVHPDVAQGMAKAVAENLLAKIGIGTTGYAEPDPSRNIVQPIAYWSIWDRRKNAEVCSGMSVGTVGVTRLEMQEQVTTNVLEALLAYLEGTV